MIWYLCPVIRRIHLCHVLYHLGSVTHMRPNFLPLFLLQSFPLVAQATDLRVIPVTSFPWVFSMARQFSTAVLHFCDQGTKWPLFLHCPCKDVCRVVSLWSKFAYSPGRQIQCLPLEKRTGGFSACNLLWVPYTQVIFFPIIQPTGLAGVTWPFFMSSCGHRGSRNWHKNADTLAIATAMSKKWSFVSDSRDLCLLSASMKLW